MTPPQPARTFTIYDALLAAIRPSLIGHDVIVGVGSRSYAGILTGAEAPFVYSDVVTGGSPDVTHAVGRCALTLQVDAHTVTLSGLPLDATVTVVDS